MAERENMLPVIIRRTVIGTKVSRVEHHAVRGRIPKRLAESIRSEEADALRKPLAETNLKRVVIARQEAVIQECAVGSAEIGERKSGNAGTGGRGIELLDAG